jgi:anhydro-N-acetylmuramic acid kinase
MTLVVGLMSGTSLDGISAAVVHFAEGADGRPVATLRAFRQRPYTSDARRRLEAAMHEGSAQLYCRLSADLGDWLADAALDVMQAAGVSRDEVRAIASHGQTLWHEPGHSTWQIGDAARIAERTGCAVVSDFRTRDVAAGGQGAPLVPIADRLLFSHAQSWRALQNIGGIGNVTVVPPAGSDAPILAFDTGPGVVITDGVVRRLFDRPYDENGAIAARGRILDEAMRGLLSLPFFFQSPPKSTGRELFTPAFIDDFIARCRTFGASDADVVATSVGFTAATIAGQYTQFITAPITEVLLSGGGAKHPLLAPALEGAFRWHQARTGRPVPQVRQFSDVYFDAEAKEAVAFALLGYLHLTGRAGNVPSATGARGPRVLGSLTPANSVELKS